MTTKKLKIGDRVRISQNFTWARGSEGRIANHQWETGKHGTVSIDGAGRKTIGAKNEIRTSYYVVFNEPQFDADGDGPYYAAEIDSEYLKCID